MLYGRVLPFGWLYQLECVTFDSLYVTFLVYVTG